MEIERLKTLIVFDIMPSYAKQVGLCFTKDKLQEVTEPMLKQLVTLVYPDSVFSLEGVTTIKVGKHQEENTFYKKFEDKSD